MQGGVQSRRRDVSKERNASGSWREIKILARAAGTAPSPEGNGTAQRDRDATTMGHTTPPASENAKRQPAAPDPLLQNEKSADRGPAQLVRERLVGWPRHDRALSTPATVVSAA
jgi:hypothetical protein